MNHDKVLLLELKERVSASGNRYMSGWLGKASVVAFLDKDAAEPTWQVYVQTPTPKPEGQQQRSAPAGNGNGFQRQPGRSAKPVPAGMLDDDVNDLGR